MDSVTESDGVGSSIDKSELFQNSQSLLGESADVTRRRRYFFKYDSIAIIICMQSFFSSNRSIKRKKFDDELVEYSLGLPGVSNIKVNLNYNYLFYAPFNRIPR